jgi:hypothetical protein
MAQVVKWHNKFVGLTFTKKDGSIRRLNGRFNVRSKTGTADSGEAQANTQQFTTLKTADFVTSTWTITRVLGQWALNYLFKIVLIMRKARFSSLQ